MWTEPYRVAKRDGYVVISNGLHAIVLNDDDAVRIAGELMQAVTPNDTVAEVNDAEH